MQEAAPQEITHLLQAWRSGDASALERLTPLVYQELHRLAHKHLARERQGEVVLQTSALVNEAYLRLVDAQTVDWQNRAHFFGVSAQLMRRILVDLARQRQRVSGKSVQPVSLRQAEGKGQERRADLLALDDALRSLAALDERKSRVVELRYFGGLDNKEIAEVLGVSENTVIREWGRAKAWLYRELKKTSSDTEDDACHDS